MVIQNKLSPKEINENEEFGNQIIQKDLELDKNTRLLFQQNLKPQTDPAGRMATIKAHKTVQELDLANPI